MTKNPITYKVPSSVSEIIKTLIKNNITGLPLADSRGKYAGIISRRDVFDHPDEDQTAMSMRKASTVYEDQPIENAAEEMIKQNRRHVTVLDSENRITGILTPQNFLPEIRARFGKRRVKEVLRGVAIPVWEETPLNVVALTMRLSRVYACPVVDEDGNFRGLITDRDLFENVDVGTSHHISEAGMADDEDPWSWIGIRNVVTYLIEKRNIVLPREPVRKFMITEPVVTNNNDTLEAAVKKMEAGNYNQLPVLQGTGQLVDMLYDIQILSVFL
ncbi:MAG: CBS domain-containing protein [Candidatus Thermoplasmatota archaeon]|nr:CBS domain-containing protein [Candidatus Thermoplasmatota archaeon]MCL5955788.1 CBS domain-containing protein [Candidatus Thermoplasmatota archaeon]